MIMQFKQISATKVGEKYDIILYALSDEGDIYVLHTHARNPGHGEWKKVGFKLENN